MGERARSSKATYDSIEAMAKTSFAKHELLAKAPIYGTWHVREPGTSHFAFNIHFDRGVVAIWGDLGEFVIRHSDVDSIDWLLGCCGRDHGSYCDYFLGKVRASEGPRKEFMYDDAIEYLDQWAAEVKGDLIDETGAQDDHVAKELENIEMVRGALSESRYEQPSAQAHDWHNLMHEAGHDEPPTCEGWAPSMLWLWQMAKTFSRLYVAKYNPAIASHAGIPVAVPATSDIVAAIE